MSLIERLRKVKPRENSGSVSSNRFDYQKNWAICKLLELSEHDDFLLAFEFYEDIIVFDSSDKPNFIDFYQVKTKSTGKHSISSLIKKKNGSSILGKLFDNKVSFKFETSSLNIISNCDYKLELESGEKVGVKICCNNLSTKEKKKLADALSSELSISWLQDYYKLIFFEKSDLTIEHHSELTQQKLNRFIETRGGGLKYNPSLAYRTIFDEVKRRNNVEKELSSFEELVKFKSISKNEFEKIIDVVTSEPNRFDDLKKEIINRLDSEKASLSFRRFFKKNWKGIEIEYLKPSNLLFKKIVSLINDIIEENESYLDEELVSVVDLILGKLLTIREVKNQLIYDEDNLRVMIIKELCDGE